MHADHYIDLIVRAAAAPDGGLLRAIARQLAACEAAHSVLRAKGYGAAGMDIDSTARLVPHNRE